MAETTVPMSKATRDRLKKKGKKGESYDTLLNRLLDQLDAVTPEAV